MQRIALAVTIFLAVIILAGFALPDGSRAQPAPSFRAECHELRAAIARLKAEKGDAFASEPLTISVDAVLTRAEMRGPLAYMSVCGAPAPQVICVTYRLDDWKAGDRVLLSGSLDMRDENVIVLDPCLHARP